ncbi:MAG: hypothetical protein ABI120_22180 [Gemmatimonadaceae bacterium]
MDIVSHHIDRGERKKSLILQMASGSIVALTALVLHATSAHADDPYEYDENGNISFPILCPLELPTGNWTWDVSENYVWVPKYNLPAGDEVKFGVSSLYITTAIQPVMIGFGWYRTLPATATADGLNWIWDGPGGGGGVLYTCREEWLFYGLFGRNNAKFTGQVWGYAVVDGANPRTTGTRSGGGGEGETCYEIFEWWIDLNGHYHEEVLYQWCEPEWET